MPKVLIIDDEVNARRDLRTLLGGHPDITIIGEAATVQEGRELLRTATYDLVFLDVQLLGGTGFDLMPDVSPQARVIFVSAFDHFALRAFEVNALDYLQKPVRVARLAATLLRLADRAPTETPENKSALRTDDLVQVKTGPGAARFVRTGEIVAIFSEDNYSELRLVNGEKLLVRQTLSSWEERLPTTHFMRVHRSTLINASFVQGYQHEDTEASLIRLEHLHEPVRARRHYWTDLIAKLNSLGRKLDS